MKAEMISVGRLLFCAIDVYMIYRFFKSMFHLRKSRKMGLFICLSAVLVIFLVNAFGITWLNLIIIPLVFLLFSLSIFDLSFTQGIVYTIIYYAIFGGGREIAHECLLRMLSTSINISSGLAPGGIYYFVPEYLLSFLFLLLIERFTKKLEVKENKEFAWYLLIMPISSIIVLSCFLYMDFPDSLLIQRLMCIGAFALYFSNAAIFITLGKYTGIMNQMKYEELSAMKQDMKGDNYRKIMQLNEYYRNCMHDTHKYLNHIRVLASKGQVEKIIEMIDESEGILQLGSSDTIYSGNETLNAIFTEGAVKARNEGIELSVFIENFLKVDFISDIDMVSMFGNLLDNALEAAAQCEIGNRKVEVKLFMGNQYMLVFYIKNTFLISAQRKGERLLTTKKDMESHGLGIGIVNKLAEKYGGTLTLEEKKTIFEASLIISASKNG